MIDHYMMCYIVGVCLAAVNFLCVYGITQVSEQWRRERLIRLSMLLSVATLVTMMTAASVH